MIGDQTYVLDRKRLDLERLGVRITSTFPLSELKSEVDRRKPGGDTDERR
jgi:hypothetical protein